MMLHIRSVAEAWYRLFKCSRDSFAAAVVLLAFLARHAACLTAQRAAAVPRVIRRRESEEPANESIAI